MKKSKIDVYKIILEQLSNQIIDDKSYERVDYLLQTYQFDELEHAYRLAGFDSNLQSYIGCLLELRKMSTGEEKNTSIFQRIKNLENIARISLRHPRKLALYMLEAYSHNDIIVILKFLINTKILSKRVHDLNFQSNY